jgi:hypothetical protein
MFVRVEQRYAKVGIFWCHSGKKGQVQLHTRKDSKFVVVVVVAVGV